MNLKSGSLINVAAITALVWLWTLSAAAHHAFTAEFDGTKFIDVRGTVTKMEWINPHSWIYLDVKDESGQVTNWAFELGAPNSLLRAGWRKDSIKPGLELVLRGYRAKSGKPIANARDVVFPDGRELFVGSSAPDAPVRPK